MIVSSESHGSPPRKWHKLAAELEDLCRTIDRGGDPDALMPRLGVTTALVPGECWFFEPGWFNLKWRWDEITVSAQTARNSLIKLGAYYVHERVLGDFYIQELASPSIAELGHHLAQVRQVRSSLLEVVCSRLFALREKVAWVIYEIMTSHLGTYIPPTRVGYTSVRRELESTITSGRGNVALISTLRDILAGLNDAHVQELYRFRHGYVHQLRPYMGPEQPSLLVQIRKGVWDSLKMGHLRTRFVVHLASHTWLRLVMAIRALANVPLPRIGLTFHTAPQTVTELPYWFGVHSGIGGDTRDGRVVVTCMRECRGFKAVLRLNPRVKVRTRKLRDWQRMVSDILLRCIPYFEPEKHSGTVKFLVLPKKNATLLVALLTKQPAAEPLLRTHGEEFGEWAGQQGVEGGVPLERDDIERLVRESEELGSWPEVAREAMINVILGTGVRLAPIVHENAGAREQVRHVAFRSEGGGYEQLLVVQESAAIPR